MEDPELLKDFLIESNENLARLDREMVELEQRPKDEALLASIFRTIHTIKGTCGFLGFTKLEKVTHLGENILSQVRNFERDLEPELVSLILEMVDAIKGELQSIEATTMESAADHGELLGRLNDAYQMRTSPKPPPPTEPMPEAVNEALIQPQSAYTATLEMPHLEPVPQGLAGQPQPPQEIETSTKSAAADSTIRVDVGLLDRLMNLVGELVLARNQILQFGARQEDAAFTATSQRLNLITTQLQEGVMKTRMQPIGVVWNKLPRVVRDLAASCGKRIELDMDGAGTELDKSIIEAIKDPLTHIVRNSCDHGLETPALRQQSGKPAAGRLALRAFHEGGQVNIEISDDGRGIDPERIKLKAVQKGLIRLEQAERMSEREAIHLVFQPGFSTAEQVTNISGRGVGMDVVKTNIEKIGGTVDIVSRRGHGTTVKIKIPLTLAIIPGLVVMTGSERFVIPQVSLLELVRLEGDAANRLIERIQGTRVYRRRGNLLPIVYLNEALHLQEQTGNDAINIVILQAEDKQFGLVVDAIHDTQEIVVKPLGKQLKGLSCYAGATIMGDGRVALILDVLGLGLANGVLSESRETMRDSAQQSAGGESERQTLLLFRSGRYERLAVPLSLVARLEEFPQNKIERASGQMVVQYRGQILPLLPLHNVLGSGGDSSQDRDPVQVIVFSDGERRIGLLVDQILDIVEDTIAARQKSGRQGLLGSAVVGQKVTDFLDLHAVISSHGGNWFSSPATNEVQRVTVLIAESSAFARGLLRHQLEMAGHRVLEASSVAEALDRIGRFPVDIAAIATDLAGGGGSLLAQQLHKQVSVTPPRLISLSHDPGDEAEGGFDDQLSKFDREAMLRSVERLSTALHAANANAKPVQVVN